MARGKTGPQCSLRTLLQTLSATPSFSDWLMVSISTPRGTALVAAIPGAEREGASWPVVRRQLLRSLGAVIEDAQASTGPKTAARGRRTWTRVCWLD